jgi:hypothetical protein
MPEAASAIAQAPVKYIRNGTGNINHAATAAPADNAEVR